MITSELHPDISAPNVGALRIKTFRWIMAQQVEHGALVDLGAGPCKFAQIAHELGYPVTAVDARDERLPSDLQDIHFIKADVRAFDLSPFKIILNIGLLYHLTLEDQIELLSRTPRGSTVVLDTQVHFPELVVQENNQDGFADRVVQEGGYEGVPYPEKQNAMASIGNALSWWHTETSLLRMLENTGASSVAKIEPAYVSKYGGRKWYIARFPATS